jgi:hypothetical protein
MLNVQEQNTEEDLRFESLDSIVLDLSDLARAGLPPHLLVKTPSLNVWKKLGIVTIKVFIATYRYYLIRIE